MNKIKKAQKDKNNRTTFFKKKKSPNRDIASGNNAPLKK